MLEKASLILLTTFTASAALAEDYGMRGGTAVISKEHVSLSGDFRIGPAHSIQLSGQAEDVEGEMIGSIVGHLHLEPRSDRRYGFVLGVMDVDDRAASAGMIGLSGQYHPGSLGSDTTFSGLATIGQASDGPDFIALQANARTKATESLELGLGVRAAEFDESVFDFISWGIDITAGWQIPDTDFGIELRGTREGLSGQGGARAQNRVELVGRYHFGKDKYRTIAASNPVDQLVRFEKF